jgi:phage portal protein BeeE
MGLRDRLAAWFTPDEVRGYDPFNSLTLANGYTYPLQLNLTQPGQRDEEPDGTFPSFVSGAYRTNSVVFACMLVRQLLFSEARFQFQALRKGRPGDLFSTPALDILEHPWPGATTGDLLSQILTFADLEGNAFTVRRGNRLVNLRPDWVSIILSSASEDIDAEVVGYAYYPGGKYRGVEPEILQRSEVAHFAPIKDPVARYRGMSPLTPLVREFMADSAATSHKLSFFQNSATPNAVVKLNAALSPDKFLETVDKFKKAEPSGRQAYKTLFLDNLTDVTVIGANLRQMDFKVTQGAGETRIAAALGVPPIIVGLSEGLQAATYSNYGQARRRFADGTMRPLWRNIAGSLETLVPAPGGSRLWYDDRDIQFLAEDKKDLAEVHQLETQQIRTLVDGGYKPDSVVAAVMAGDFSLLTHTGLYSVQLQPPGTIATPAPTNGKVPTEAI